MNKVNTETLEAVIANERLRRFFQHAVRRSLSSG